MKLSNRLEAVANFVPFNSFKKPNCNSFGLNCNTSLNVLINEE